MTEFGWVAIYPDGDGFRIAKPRHTFWYRVRRWFRWQRHMRVVRRDRRQHAKTEKDRAQMWDKAVAQELEEHAGAWERLARGES